MLIIYQLDCAISLLTLYNFFLTTFLPPKNLYNGFLLIKHAFRSLFTKKDRITENTHSVTLSMNNHRSSY